MKLLPLFCVIFRVVFFRSFPFIRFFSVCISVFYFGMIVCSFFPVCCCCLWHGIIFQYYSLFGNERIEFRMSRTTDSGTGSRAHMAKRGYVCVRVLYAQYILIWVWMLAHVLVACITQINHYSAPNKTMHGNSMNIKKTTSRKEKKNNRNWKHSIDFRIIRKKLFILGDFPFSCRLRVFGIWNMGLGTAVIVVVVAAVVAAAAADGFVAWALCLPCKITTLSEVRAVCKKQQPYSTNCL